MAVGTNSQPGSEGIMLEQTFIHIPGVGRQTERELWANGIHDWDDADLFEKRFGRVGARLQHKLDDYIPRSREAIKQKDAAFFERRAREILWGGLPGRSAVGEVHNPPVRPGGIRVQSACIAQRRP